MYFPADQHELGAREMAVVVSAALPPQTLTNAVRGAVRSLDPDQPIFGVKTMDQVVADSISSERLNATLMAIFTAVAVLLAAAGIYGVMSYLVNQRTREFGVRIALGAAVGDVLRLVFGEVALLGAIAAGLGMAGAFGATRLLQRFIPGVAGADLLIFGGVSVVLALVVTAAALIPAARATRVHPMEALRWE
jgi:putative ABC transport system permease protein